MINLVFKEKNNLIMGFTCNGHAGYASSGEDIVCAAISSLVQNAEICLSEVMNIKLNVQRNYIIVEATCKSCTLEKGVAKLVT